MKTILKKAFEFSASFSRGDRALGRNYVLWVAVESLDESGEEAFIQRIEQMLIQNIRNRDLTSHPDFPKGRPITDTTLLQVFWDILSRDTAPSKLVSLELERDRKTRTLLTV